MAKLVQVPGTSHYVNPDYVTNVYPTSPVYGPGPIHGRAAYISALEVEGNAGYRTKEIRSTASAADLAKLINGEA